MRINEKGVLIFFCFSVFALCVVFSSAAFAKGNLKDSCKKGALESCGEMCRGGDEWGCKSLRNRCDARDDDACFALVDAWSAMCAGGNDLKCDSLKKRCFVNGNDYACTEACKNICVRKGLCEASVAVEYCGAVMKAVNKFKEAGFKDCVNESGHKYGDKIGCEADSGVGCEIAVPGDDDSNVCVDVARYCADGMSVACLDVSDCLLYGNCDSVVEGCRIEGLCKQAIRDINGNAANHCNSVEGCKAQNILCKKGVGLACDITQYNPAEKSCSKFKCEEKCFYHVLNELPYKACMANCAGCI